MTSSTPSLAAPGTPHRRRRVATAWTLIVLAALVTVATLVLRARLVAPLPAGIFLRVHSVAELLAVLVSFAIFAVLWHVGRVERESLPSQLLAAVFLAVATLDALHLATFPGTAGAFLAGGSLNQTIVYWLGARVIAALGLATAAALALTGHAMWRRGRVFIVALAAVLAGIPIAVALVAGPGGTTLFDPARGPTELKVAIEWAIIGVSVAAIPLYLRVYWSTGDRSVLSIVGALVLTALSELSVTLYTHPNDTFGLLGHVYKVAAYYLIFEALFVATLLRPYERLEASARDLMSRNEELARLRELIQGELATTISRLEQTSEAERRARAEAERYSERVRSMLAITEPALGQLELEPLLDSLLTRLRAALDADGAVIVLLSRDGQSLDMAGAQGYSLAELAPRIPVANSLSGRIIVAREPLALEDLTGVEIADPAVRARARSFIGAPLLVEGRAIGVLHVDSFRPRRFTAEHVRDLQLVADRVASAIERARLLAQLEAIVAAVPAGLIVYDTEGVVELANPAADRILGLPAAQRRLPARLGPLQMQKPSGEKLRLEEHPAMRALAGEIVEPAAYQLRRAGRVAWISMGAAPVRDRGGRVLGAVATLTDVTALHELQEQREDLLRAISHDLRAPLSAVQLQAQLLERKATEPDAVVRGANSIVTSARRMNAMIEDLVDLARSESGQLRLNLSTIELEPFARDVRDRMAGVMDVQRIRMHIPQDLPAVRADPDRLERILLNLLTNALKYSAPGADIVISARPAGGEVEIAVTDSGPGIPPDELPHLFERFYRADRAHRAEGLGLGLYITRTLVEVHGGRITVESELGRGTTFRIFLAAQPRPAEHADAR